MLERFPVVMSFIPTWSFFAPTPGMHDYHLLYRGINDNGEVQDWREAYPIKEKRGRFSFIWHPDKKFLKSLMDLVHELIRFSIVSDDKKQICISVPYLHILNYVTFLASEKSIKKVQFMILSSSRLYDYNVEFLSSAHSLTVRSG
ncbi:MAG TPA: hypothetical protein VLE95_07870 [Chlamydiales bacterium]|nr:hypothetical protein [Chlamydiales bacterium]